MSPSTGPARRLSGLARSGARVLAMAGVVIAVIAARVIVESRAELAAARGLEAEGKESLAVVHYRRAVSWYAPGSPYPREALEGLVAIARAAEEAGDRDRALVAWRSIRAGILAARSAYTPYADDLAVANGHIAELAAATPRRRRAERALLERTTRPNVGFVILLLGGLATWVSAAFVFSRRAIDDEDRFVPREARLWGTVVIVGFGMFALGLALA